MDWMIGSSIPGGELEIFLFTTCAFVLYPSSGVSRTNKIEELNIIDKKSQYTRPQTNHTRVNY
jgi:hypothetical protein